MDNNSLAHTKWNCKYHIVFTLKYRRHIKRMLCARKGITIIEAAAMQDRIYLYESIPPK